MVLVVYACSSLRFKDHLSSFNQVTALHFANKWEIPICSVSYKAQMGATWNGWQQSNSAKITARQSKTEVPQDFLWSPPSISFRGLLMVSPWAPGLPEVHTKHHHKANWCTATRCHVHTVIRFRCQKHLNMIACTSQGMLMQILLQLPKTQALNAEAEHLGHLDL